MSQHVKIDGGWHPGPNRKTWLTVAESLVKFSEKPRKLKIWGKPQREAARCHHTRGVNSGG